MVSVMVTCQTVDVMAASMRGTLAAYIMAASIATPFVVMVTMAARKGGQGEGQREYANK